MLFPVIARVVIGLEHDHPRLKGLPDAFAALEQASDPGYMILFPLAPTLARIRCAFAIYRIWKAVKSTINERAQSGEAKQDILQSLLDEVDDPSVHIKVSACFFLLSYM
jgi:hypothetical protein